MLDTSKLGRPLVWRIVAEAAGVGLLGAVLALLANQISPHRLQLARNYFPGDLAAAATNASVNPPVFNPASPTNTSSGLVSATNSANPATSLLGQKLRAEGLHLVGLSQVEKLFHDPQVQENLIIFIDARAEDDYANGHIPGAYEFYSYHPERYLAAVLTPCQIARQIVVYCTGGDCEDSHSAALFLRDTGVPAEKLFVFAGGITEWEAAKLPLEAGARDSGDIHTPAP